MEMIDPKVFERNPEWQISHLQLVAYVAAGGGMLGASWAQCPAGAYIDNRVRNPVARYTKNDVYKIIDVLTQLAKARGLDPYALPRLPTFHNCGVF
jgi:aryl-alcohol dehydrogenase-like predicted oxidoreductase